MTDKEFQAELERIEAKLRETMEPEFLREDPVAVRTAALFILRTNTPLSTKASIYDLLPRRES